MPTLEVQTLRVIPAFLPALRLGMELLFPAARTQVHLQVVEPAAAQRFLLREIVAGPHGQLQVALAHLTRFVVFVRTPRESDVCTIDVDFRVAVGVSEEEKLPVELWSFEGLDGGVVEGG
jgi:hypothetical protein